MTMMQGYQIAKRFKMSDKDICEALGKEFE